MPRTTIQLQESTKSDLEDLKRVDGESYDSVVKLLIANYNNPQDEQLTESDVEAIAERVFEDKARKMR